MKRRRAIAGLLAACRRITCGTRAGRNSAAGRRGRRRSAYEAPRAAADGGTRLGGAESKRRRRPRLPAPPSRVTLLAAAPALRPQRDAHRLGRPLDRGERLRQRGARRLAALLAPYAVERVDEGAVARAERVQRRERGGRRPAAPRPRLVHECLCALERVGELGHALGRQAPARHEVRPLARHSQQQVGVRRREASVGPPEAAGDQRERQRRLDPGPAAAYDRASRSRMAPVSRLPSIYFEKLLERSPDIVRAVDRQRTITFYNDGARQTLGYTPDEVLGQHVTRLYPDRAAARKVMAAMRQGKNCETTFVTKNGVSIPVLIAGSIIRDTEGHELGSIRFAKDLREIRRHD